MLNAVRLQNFRSFADTEEVRLSKLNVLIGPNNAGKTTLASAIELFFRTLKAGPRQDPLALEEMSAFASFDSILRRHWAPGEQRPKHIRLEYWWSARDEAAARYSFTCQARPKDNTTYVAEAAYELGDDSIHISRKTVSPTRSTYQVASGSDRFVSDRLYFQSGLPLPYQDKRLGASRLLDRARTRIKLEVIHPSRPVPRSYYVLDDPSLTPSDRDLLSYLIRIWSSEEVSAKRVRRRIVQTLDTLALARLFEVHQISRRLGPKVFEIRVAPTIRRHRVTIADAGFGLSQALPLAAYEARLFQGHLIAYQPEVHLHPYAQSRLADVFVNSLARGNQIFVETHSPDLILRLQAKIASGELKSTDVCILCVENVKGRSLVRSVALGSSGAPSIPWPAGFLDTSLTLARELASARLKKK